MASESQSCDGLIMNRNVKEKSALNALTLRVRVQVHSRFNIKRWILSVLRMDGLQMNLCKELIQIGINDPTEYFRRMHDLIICRRGGEWCKCIGNWLSETRPFWTMDDMLVSYVFDIIVFLLAQSFSTTS